MSNDAEQQRLELMSRIAMAVETIAKHHNQNFRPILSPTSDTNEKQLLELLARIANALETVANAKK
jgi:hypothetical protein